MAGPEVLEAATPAEAAAGLRTTEWWVREQCRRRRVPHLRTGRGRISLLPDHIKALARLAQVEVETGRPLPAQTVAALEATPRSRAAHRARRTT
jgi:hypothetical protein